MILTKVFIFSTLLTVSWCTENLTFPPWFKFGSASSSYQVEGAWNVSDKSENIWDRFTHMHPGAILDGTNGDTSADSYHQWKQDIDMVSELGVHFYRFSISWSRLLPNGFSNYISEDGKNYYNNLIDGLLERGIEPVITLYHWDLPQVLQDLGGWTNPLISDWFADYTTLVYSLYADRVKTWFTINEPVVLCESSYKSGQCAPGILDPDIGHLLCIKHTLIAHAKAWRIYDENFKMKYHGKASIVNHLLWVKPYSDENEELTELAMQYANGLYFHPIYSEEGGWPLKIMKYMEELSIKQGYSRSRLPHFSREEIDLVKGTYDFAGINYYTTRLARHSEAGESVSNVMLDGIPDLDVVFVISPNWTAGFSPKLPINPVGLRESVAWFKDMYGDVEILITENGFSSSGSLYDYERSVFIGDHLEQVLLSIQDGVNVTGYTYWSLMDCFEWADGYVPTLGLFKVDFTSPLRTRTPRASAHYYKEIIRSHSLHSTRDKSLF